MIPWCLFIFRNRQVSTIAVKNEWNQKKGSLIEPTIEAETKILEANDQWYERTKQRGITTTSESRQSLQTTKEVVEKTWSIPCLAGEAGHVQQAVLY